jgi:hypothetical protein
MTNDLRSPDSTRGTTLAHARWADPICVAEKYRTRKITSSGRSFIQPCPRCLK